MGFLQLILPNAKVIDARRHPLDSCLGSYKQLFFKGQSFTYEQFELGHYYLQYRRIMEHWKDVLPGKVLDVHYEQMVATRKHKHGVCWSIADYPGKTSACGFTKQSVRSIRPVQNRYVSRSIPRRSISGAITSRTWVN